MSFVLKDFQAGFALGRALWKPPRMKTEIDTGFGWAADPAYLVYNADTYLGTITSGTTRSFKKSDNGWAVSAFLINYDHSWTGPVLISTSEQAVRYEYNETSLPSSMTFSYIGLTWYANFNHHFSNVSSYDNGRRPIIDCAAFSDRYPVEQILQAARVRLTGGGS